MPLLLLASCTGEMSPSRPGAPAIGARLLDTNRNGRLDALDLDGDRRPEVRFNGRECSCDDALVDQDGDGQPDGVDLDCDGNVDVPVCETPLLDADGDGVVDGVDLDCDGTPDVPPSDDEGEPAGVPDDGWCHPTPVDPDGDGIADGMDLDCDGDAEMDWDGDGWGWGEGHGDGDGSFDDDPPAGCDPACIDTNADGVEDQFDWNCDGQGDDPMEDCITVPDGLGGESFQCEGEGVGECFPEPVDWNGDDDIDGMDVNCDGAADYSC